MKKLGGELERSAGDDELLERVVAYYQESLKESPEALEYLATRGLSAELVTHFRLGFSNRTLGYRLPDKTRTAGAELRGRLERLGVFRESGHEHFNGSLVVPIFDEAGRVTEMYGRKVTAKLRPGTPLHFAGCAPVTRIGASSIAAPRMNECSPPFTAATSEPPGRGRSEATPVVYVIEPPRLRRGGGVVGDQQGAEQLGFDGAARALDLELADRSIGEVCV